MTTAIHNQCLPREIFIMRRIIGAFLLSLALCLGALPFAARADLIVLKDGHEYNGTLVKATDTEVVFRQDAGDKSYARAEVVHVRLQKERPWDRHTNLQEIPDAGLGKLLDEPLDPRQTPGAAYLVLQHKTMIELRSAQTWAMTRRLTARILKEHGEAVSVQEWVTRRDVESLEVHHAMCIRPDGSVLHLQESAIQEEAVNADLPQYDTLMRHRFALPDGKPGNVLDSQMTVVRAKPVPGLYFYEEFTFGGQEPERNVTVAVLVPTGCELRWQVLNDAAGAVLHAEEKTAGGTWYRWSRAVAPQLLPEPMAPPVQDSVPRLVLTTAPGTWGDIAKVLAADITRQEQALQELPAAPAGSVDEVWDYVSRNTQDVGLSLEATGYQPGDPRELLRLRRGPALDRTFLLYAWLKKAGVAQAKWCWIRPRAYGVLAANAPALQAFSEPAVLLDAPGKPRFLIPGDDMDNAAELMVASGGATCLVAGEGLREVPVANPATRGLDQVIALTLNAKGDAVVKQTISYRGGEAKSLRAWRRMTDDEIRNAVQGTVRNVDAGARDIRHRILGDVKRNDVPLALELQYVIPGFADARPSLFSARLPWLKYEASMVGRDQRRLPLFWDSPRQDTLTITVTPPPGMVFYAGADPNIAGTDDFKYQTTLSHADGQSQFSSFYQRRVIQAQSSQYADLKASLQARAATGRQFWVWRTAK